MNAEGPAWVSCKFYLAAVAILALYGINMSVAYEDVSEHTAIYIIAVGSYGDPLIEDQTF